MRITRARGILATRKAADRCRDVVAAIILGAAVTSAASVTLAYDLSIYPEISRHTKTTQPQPAAAPVPAPSFAIGPRGTHTADHTAPATRRAGSGGLGFYLGGRALPSASNVRDETLDNGQGGNFVKLGDDYDTTIGTSAVAGYHWNGHGLPVRTEIEAGYRFRNDFNTRELDVDPTPIGYKNDLSTVFVMLNGYVDFETDTAWRPYIGAGIGWARNRSSTTRSTGRDGSTPETIDNDADNFAFSATFGARVAFSKSWVGDIGYRFMSLGEVDSGRFSGGDNVTAEHHYTHDIVLGVSYLF